MSGGGGGNGGGLGMPRNTTQRRRDSDGQGSMFSDGLNPNRQKGFGAAASKRIETPSLNDMRARQGAVYKQNKTTRK